MLRQLMSISMLCLLILVTLGSTAFTQEEGMPPMGATDEIKQLSWLVGTWDTSYRFKMSDTSDQWMESTGIAVYSFELDSSVILMDYSSEMMGMPFKGNLVETFDRITGNYQTVWVDNMSARMSYYEGYKSGDSTVLSGKDLGYDGGFVLVRITTFNETPESFDWKMEMSSDEGKTFWTTGEARYTKRK